MRNIFRLNAVVVKLIVKPSWLLKASLSSASHMASSFLWVWHWQMKLSYDAQRVVVTARKMYTIFMYQNEVWKFSGSIFFSKYEGGFCKKISCVCVLVWFNPLKCFFGSEGHVALDRNPGPGYDTLLLWIIPGDLLIAFPHIQFHTLPGLLDSWAVPQFIYDDAFNNLPGHYQIVKLIPDKLQMYRRRDGKYASRNLRLSSLAY